MFRPVRRLPAAAVPLVACAALAACSGGAAAPADPVIQVAKRKAAPTVSGTRLDGGTLSTSGWRGRVVVINFWGSWCGPCRSEAADLAGAAKELAPAGAQFLGVNVRDDKDKAQAFQRRFGVGYPSIFDPQGEVALRFAGAAPRSTPATVVVDKADRVAAVIDGAVDRQELVDVVHQVAAGS